MKKIIGMIVAVFIFIGCGGGRYASQSPNSKPLWLEGKRVAVCGGDNYNGVITATENALRQIYHATIVVVDCRNISSIDYLAMLEVVRSSYEAKVWLKIIGDGGQVGALGYGQSGSGYAAGFVGDSDNYIAGAVADSREQYDMLRMAVEEAVRDLH